MEYSIRKYGAVGDGVTNDASSIQQAVDECSKKGGGRVVCEAGTYLCSTITLKSNVDLYLEMGCTIISSLDSSFYTDGREALIESKDTENVSISGFGTIDGRSYLIYYDDDQDPLHEAPFDYPYGVFRPRTSKFENVKNLVIRDITIKNSVLWTLHFAGCNYVSISGVRIFNDIRCNNNDGIDPDCCKNVTISDCIIVSGDDPVVIKSTKEMAQKYGSCENIVVSNCIFKTKSAGLKIGTETWADIRNISMSNCVIEECGRAVAIWVRDGATIENVNISGIRALCRAYSGCRDNKHIGAGYPYWWGKGEAIYISNTPRNDENLKSGTIINITFDNMNIDSESSVFVSGSENGAVENIEIRNSKINLKITGTQQPGWFDYRPSPKDIIRHDIPALYVEYAKNIKLKDISVSFTGGADAWSNVVGLKNVENITITGIEGSPAKAKLPMINAVNVKNIKNDFE